MIEVALVKAPDGTLVEMWDNTKLQSYACQERGKLGYEEHLISKEPSEALVFGGAFHRAVEEWTNRRLAGDPDDVAVAAGVAAFKRKWLKELPEDYASALEISGDRRSITNFERLFKGYREKFPLESYTKIHGCEIPFTLPLGTTPAGRVVYWSGVIDRVVTWMEGLYYRDIKTTSYQLDEDFFDQFKRSGQMKGYAWAGSQLGFGQFSGVVIEGVKVEGPLKTKVRDPKDLVQAEVIPITQEHIDEWVVHTLQRIDDIHAARERGFYTMNDGDLCKQFRGGCAYSSICNAMPANREVVKANLFTKRVWTPFDAEGEGVTGERA